ncbi:aminoglycoside phosphotransferase family protein [Roseovarius sp. EL26]|uniref:aminoglycoside phosphotransferase family protein n=1 Tax=Roseovarius sp. EL26 TaxID=2126672 RepID=UPI000EA0E3C0|nr:aminoglycoside phosphotransferase family protein [Roseovarius sp. EL26]
MQKTNDNHDLSKLDATLLLAEQLEVMIDEVPELKDAHIEEMLRIVPEKRALMRGTLNERDVVFRMHLGSSNQTATREWQEYQRIWPFMCEGAYTVCEPILFLSEYNLLILQAIDGTSFLRVLRKSNHDEKSTHLETAARWLKHYMSVSEHDEQTTHRRWIKRARDIHEAKTLARFKPVKDCILNELERLARYFDERTWRTAICHGDFHSNNLIHRETTLVGFDIGRSGRSPIYRDMARFLSHLALRDNNTPDVQYLGVSQTGFSTFCRVFDLDQDEREIALPIMIGCDALLRPETLGQTTQSTTKSEAFCQALLKDLSQIRT